MEPPSLSFKRKGGGCLQTPFLLNDRIEQVTVNRQLTTILLHMKKIASILFFGWCLSLALAPAAGAHVSLPAIFSDHMVLQQKSTVTVWGWASPSEEVTVTGSWDQKAVKAKASNLARWSLQLQTPAAGGPYTIGVKGYNSITIQDVVIGEVWLCSGQSNMEWTANAGIDKGPAEIAKANYPAIRFFTVAKKTADGPQLDLDGQWVVCSPQTMPHFSAVGYFFGQKIHETLKVPVGLINSSWGGTPAEVWLNPQAVAAEPVLATAAAKLTEVPYGPIHPGKAYHAMIAPLIPFRLAGALWYQGESNVTTASAYEQLLPALVRSWRSEWQQDFPFYYVQVAPYKYGDNHSGVLLRDSQRKAMAAIPNSGMVVISDVGNTQDIHPRNKIPVGQRLANWALHQTYGKKDVIFSGPLYRSMQVQGNKVRISFDYTAPGLMVKGPELSLFEIAGADQQFVKADAKIVGNTVVVSARAVKAPVAVRYAWDNTAEPTLFNKAGLPASSFRTDAWPVE
jgi:sialate O-acetylesterase